VVDDKAPVAAENSVDEVAVPIDEAFVAIQRDPSAKGPLKQFKHQNFKNLANGDCGDGIVNPHDKSKVPDKYWAQRKRFFSRFDDGVRLDKEGWYSVTPEKIANHLAERLVEGRDDASQGMVVLDAFCGCGGNAIAFALRPEVSLVLAIDADREKLVLTANNAMVYGVPKEKLILIHGNACDALQSYKQGIRIEKKESPKETGDAVDGFQIGGMDMLPERIDSVFLSPPWGGMDYETSGKRNYHIETCIEVDATPETKWNGEEILEACAVATNGPVLYFLPRNINGISLGRSALKSKYKTLEIEMNILNNKLKTVTAYLGM
jgi:trimethylguanosine synthase